MLSFLRVCSAVLPAELLGAALPLLVQAFTQGLGPHKAKFASRARAILRKLSQRGAPAWVWWVSGWACLFVDDG